MEIIKGGSDGQEDNNMYVPHLDYTDTMNRMLKNIGSLYHFKYVFRDDHPAYKKSIILSLFMANEKIIQTEELDIK